MAVKITIPVEFQDSSQSYKQIIASLEGQLNKLKPGTVIYKDIEEQLKKAKKFSESLDLNLGRGISSSSDIDRIDRAYSSLQHTVENINRSFANLAISDLNIIPANFGKNAEELTSAAKDLAEAQKALTEQKGKKVSNLLSKENAKLFDGKQLNLTATDLLSELKTSLTEAQAEFDKTSKKVEKLKNELIELERFNENASSEIVPFASDAMSIISNNKGLEKSREAAVELFQRSFTQVEGSEDAIKSWLASIGLDPQSITKLFNEASVGMDQIKNFIENNFDSLSQEIIRNTYSDIHEKNKKLQRSINDRKTRISAKKDVIGEEEGHLNNQQKEIDSLQKQTEIISDQVYTKEIAELESKITQIQQRISELQQLLLAQKPTGVEVPNSPDRAIADEALQAENEAKKFKENLQQSISHWLSAQMVVTKVREGIHQAWTDIQGLDKAMTNIAVVTDMSVSDLWGKIDEYMAIAQEYGVTTQGVYEVSQLYYQQGLPTNEVMEATTETLKMARIAGMDYAEAADAMTVAIRAFKMEMSDAQVITDVYSKVAAVTASDSQELAIAMSKTASSAESVGSSFENTTAMLAVMIETTRESAQNLGSALKSIISRYGEMKTGLTVDSEGEAIDYNKVDTALQSVGISLKDAQGQFRDFDEVIFELSAKWDSLDKNTQRYIATIMAGNRQQSRFIALVDNWERLEEVSAAAYDSEDAGLLQYAKTLDSLETKLNALSTSFQQFYMNIVNGDTFKGLIDLVTNFINGLNKLGNWQSILNIANLITSIKMIGSLLVNSFAGPLSSIVSQIRGHADETVKIWADAGRRAAKANSDSFNAEQKNNPPNNQPKSTYKNAWGNKSELGNKVTLTSSMVSLIASSLGTIVAKDRQILGTAFSTLGNTASGVAMGSSFGVPGAIIGGITGLVSSLPAIAKARSSEERTKNRIEKAEETFDKAELDRATKKEEARNLQHTIDNLRKLQKVRYSSEEAEAAFIEASNAAFEQFPELVATFDDTGNAIVDVITEASNAEQLLIEARQAAADAAEEAAAAELKLNIEKQKQAQQEYDKYYKNNTKVDTFARNLGQQYSYLNFNGDSYKGKNILEIADGYFAAIDSYLNNYEAELRDFYGYTEDQITNEIAKERKVLEGSFFTQLSGSGIGITLDEEDLTLRGLKTGANQAKQRLNSTTGATDASREASINRVIDNLLLDIDPKQTGEWLEIEGITSTFYERVKDIIGDPESAFDPVTKELLPNVKDIIYDALETYTSAWNEISGYLTTSYQKEDFNKLLTAGKKGSITFTELNEQYAKIFEDNILSEDAQKEIDNIIRDLWFNVANNIKNLSTTLSDDSGFKWDSYGTIYDKIAKIPVQYFANLYDFSETIDAQLEKGLINESQAKDLTSRYLQMWEGLGTAGLDSEALGQARNALASADLFSISGIDALITTLKDLGIEVENLPGLKDFPVYAVNFTTEYANLIEHMNSGMEQLKKLLSNLDDGLDTEDAQSLANKMGTTLNDSSAFEFISGKWYVKNVETAVAAIEKTYSGLQSKIKTELDASIDKLQNSSDEEVAQIISANKENAEKWAREQAARGVTDLPDFDTDSRGLVAAYLKAEYAAIAEAYDIEKEWLAKEAARSLEISQEARKLEGGEEAQRKREAWNLIKSTGLTGYTSDDIAQIKKDLDISDDAFIQKDDGTWELVLDNLQEVPGYVKKALLASIDNEVQSSIDAISQLGSIAATKGNNVHAYAEAFSKLQESNEGAYEDFIDYSEYIRDAAQGDKQSADILRETITKQLFGDKGNNELSADDLAAVEEAYNKLIAEYKDSFKGNINRFFELTKKSIEGTLTEEERLEIDKLVLPENWHESYKKIFEDNTLSAIQQWERFINILTTSLPWEQVEDQVKEAQKELLKTFSKQKFGQSADTTKTLDQIKEKQGYFEVDDLSNIIGQLSSDGLNLTLDQLLTLFDVDELTGKLVLSTSEAAKQLLTILPQEYQNAFNQSDLQRQINKDLKVEEAGKTITESITGIFSDITNTSLESILKLHKMVYGEDTEITQDQYSNYKEAIKLAQLGFTANLTDIANQFISDAGATDAKIDTNQIAAAVKDAAISKINTISDAIIAGFEGTLSNQDFLSLLDNLNIQEFDILGNLNQEWVYLQNSVVATNQGLKFTSSSLYEIYSILKSINGEAAEQLLGNLVDENVDYQSIFSLLKDINDLRKKVNEEDSKIDDARRKQYQKELEIAEAILAVRSKDPGSFNFMGGDLPDNIQAPLNVWENAAQAAEILAQAKKTGKIDLTDYYNIITTAAQQLEASGQEFNLAGMSYHEAMRAAAGAMTAANGEIVVDLAKLGTNFSAGMDDMAAGLEDGLKTMAEEQIQLIDSMIAMLETLLALQNLSGGDLFGEIDLNGNGFIDFAEVFAYDAEQGKLILTQAAQEWLLGIQTAIGFIEVGGMSLTEALTTGLIKPDAFVKMMQSIADVLKGLDAGETIESIQEKIRQIIQEAFGGDTPVPVKFNVKPELQITPDGNGTYSFNGESGLTREQAQQKLVDYIKQNANELIGEGTVTLGEGNTIKITDSANVEHTIEIGTKDGKTTYTYNGTEYDTWEGALGAIKGESTPTEGTETESQGTLETGITYDGIGLNVEETFKINGGDYTSIDQYVRDKAVGKQASGITSHGFYPGGVYKGIGFSFGNQMQINGSTVTSISEYIAGILGEATTALNDFAGTITITADTEEAGKALDAIKGKIDAIKSKTVAVSVSGVYTAIATVQSLINKLNELGGMSVSASASVKGSFSGGGSRGGRSTIQLAKARGNIALASGNRTTLMGELGPELYVTDGRYYIAGAHGPEFVNLPNDAIVFNHLQTAGLLNRGHIPNTGKPVVSEERSVAFAKGTGPAAAGGIEAALEQLYTAREFWQSLLNQLSLQDMMSGSGNGGGGGKKDNKNSIKAYTEELQEWYNLSRQIADIEQRINNLIAERENIPERDGSAYLKNLRAQQALLEEQKATQKILLDYQKVQLQRQADQINNNSIWRRFLEVDTNGLLQYKKGNETNGGKGALQILQELNQMSGSKQTAYLKKIGYSYTNTDGEKLEGEELVKQFFQQLQDQIDQYDSLYDTVNETNEALSDLTSNVNEIIEEIKENQLDLEEAIFDIFVEAWEDQIKTMQEEMSLIKEANEKYINGLNEAISAERNLYDQNQTVEEREKLQRQLSLLRRSGGSASEIANLEEQIDSMLKEEYFNNQEKMIEQIQDASDKQVEQLETQIRLQEEALKYQQEHGVIWQKVYDIMSLSSNAILDFMSGNYPQFFAQSLLQQEEMLTEWAHKIGIFTEDREYQNYADYATTDLWDEKALWSSGKLSSYQKTYENMTDEEKASLKNQFISSYANSRLEGDTHEDAYSEAISSMSKSLEDKKKADDEIIHWRFKYNGTYYKHYLTKAEALRELNSVSAADKSALLSKAKTKKQKETAENTAKKRKTNATNTLKSGKHINSYSEGGLVDYTGIAMVHGSKAKPESFLNAEQTAQIRNSLELTKGKTSVLNDLQNVLLKLNTSIQSLGTINNKTETNYYTIDSGAVVIQVQELSNAYDVDSLSEDIMARIYDIGKKSTSRSVNRR